MAEEHADERISAPVASASAAPRRRRRMSPLTVIGALLMAFGLASVAWMGWQYFGTNITSTRAISDAKAEIKSGWGTTTSDAATQRVTPLQAGEGFALLRIPALDRGSEHYEQPIIVGVSADELARGVGWYPESARPGQVGNFAIAGHRITHGEPFARLMELKVGDTVIVETADDVFTYALTTAPRDKTVKDTDLWVLDPDPQHPGQPAGHATITLTTCTDLFASPQRSVGFGDLVETHKKAQ